MNLFKQGVKEKDTNDIEEKKQYESPKILVVDVDSENIDKLRAEGFNIEAGTFGKSYKCEQYDEVQLNGSLPCITEKDIVIVNLDSNKAILDGNEYRNSEIKKADRFVITIPQGQNYFNPSYFFARQNKENFDKVLKNNGIIIIFADKILYETYYLKEYKQDYILRSEEMKVSNYDWIPKYIGMNNCMNGKEIFAESKFEKLKNISNRIMNENKSEILYTCNFGKVDEHEANLFSNNLGESLGYIDYVESDKKYGFIIILPQFKNKSKVVMTLFQELIVDFRPDLFPQLVQNSWLNSEEYLLPETKKLIEDKKKIEEEYKRKTKEIDNKKTEVIEKFKFLTNILTAEGYDSFLVDNVKEILNFIGYKNVVNVDEEVEDGNRQEDLRILDKNRFDIVEVKGHKGNPTEDDCQAVVKYMSRQMREQDRRDIHGILVVNHNRILPPLERKNPAFTEAQIKDSIRDHYTLVSTWELYKAIRLFQEGIVGFEEIDAELHKPGLFKAIPSNWSNIGKVEHLFQEGTIACFYLAVDKITKDDIIFVQDGNDYFIQKVEEMTIENEQVEEAVKGAKLAIKVNKSIGKNSKVYLKY